jgi:hypothetical protein
VESDRFDDVGFRMIEEPSREPRRRPDGRLAAVFGGALVAGALALGSSALAAQDDPTPPAASPAFIGSGHHNHSGRGCHRHHDGGSSSSSEFRY